MKYENVTVTEGSGHWGQGSRHLWLRQGYIYQVIYMLYHTAHMLSFTVSVEIANSLPHYFQHTMMFGSFSSRSSSSL